MYGCAKLAGFTDEKIGGLRLRLTHPANLPYLNVIASPLRSTFAISPT
jgi:hypothetical protein